MLKKKSKSYELIETSLFNIPMEMRWSSGEYIREEVYPIMRGLDLYLTKGKAISCNSKAFNQLKLYLREYEKYFNEHRCENFDMIGTYRPYHFNKENFGLYLYAEMFGMYLFSIIRQTSMTLRQAHTLALDAILTHGSFHYLLERYCILTSDVGNEMTGLYPSYKKRIYSQTWGTPECLEETLANAFVLKAHSLWDGGKKEYLRTLYIRQRDGYWQANDLGPELYRELFQALERQILAQGIGMDSHPNSSLEIQRPTLYDFIHKNMPFRYIGLPVYLVNDCNNLEDFIRIVEVFFPQI